MVFQSFSSALMASIVFAIVVIGKVQIASQAVCHNELS